MEFEIIFPLLRIGYDHYHRNGYNCVGFNYVHCSTIIVFQNFVCFAFFNYCVRVTFAQALINVVMKNLSRLDTHN